jgi:hypothetical protein
MSGDSLDPAAATAAFERAVTSAQAQNAKLLELRAITHLVVHQRRLGQDCAAIERLETLCQWFSTSPDLPDVVRAQGLLVPETHTT